MLAFPVNIKYNMLHTIYEVIVMADFTYEITEKLGTISQGKNGWSKELNLVSWGGRAPKYDMERRPQPDEKRRFPYSGRGCRFKGNP